LTVRQTELEQQLAVSDIYEDTQKKSLKKLLEEKAGVDCDLIQTEEAWFVVGEELEVAERE